MRIGCTGNKERIASLKECGFDYAELALWNFVDSSEEDILEIEKLLAAGRKMRDERNKSVLALAYFQCVYIHLSRLPSQKV